MKQPISKVFLHWLAVVLWLAVIYYFSDQPDLKSSLQPIWDLVFRKIAHAAEFFVLAFLFFNALRSSGLAPTHALLLAGVLSIKYAFFDEWHQGSVAGRTSSLLDVGIDSIGVLFFMMLRYVSNLKTTSQDSSPKANPPLAEDIRN